MKKIFTIREISRLFSRSSDNELIIIGRTEDYLSFDKGRKSSKGRKRDIVSFEQIRNRLKADTIQLGKIDYYDPFANNEIKQENIIIAFFS